MDKKTVLAFFTAAVHESSLVRVVFEAGRALELLPAGVLLGLLLLLALERGLLLLPHDLSVALHPRILVLLVSLTLLRLLLLVLLSSKFPLIAAWNSERKTLSCERSNTGHGGVLRGVDVRSGWGRVASKKILLFLPS